ncbi:MAG: TetR family transcriptional regulator [Mediterraneibacter faecis]
MTEVKKELTKDLLALSFKELIMKMPFEKITVKMITDGADVIRPTFYKHFQDKYEISNISSQKKSKIRSRY